MLVVIEVNVQIHVLVWCVARVQTLVIVELDVHV